MLLQDAADVVGGIEQLLFRQVHQHRRTQHPIKAVSSLCDKPGERRILKPPGQLWMRHEGFLAHLSYWFYATRVEVLIQEGGKVAPRA